jgi:hypothetical protein
MIVDKTGKIIRVVAIIMMGLTAAMNLLGGIGTTCAAFSNNVGYRMAFKDLMDYRWLYQILVVTTIVIGIAGIWAVIKLVKGGPKVFRDALIILVIGTILAGVQYFASMTLRGKAAPANVKFFLNLLTLFFFLIIRIPGIWKHIDFSARSGKTEAKVGVGLASIIIGVLAITVFTWAAPSHTFFQQNWTYVLYVPLNFFGIGLIVLGTWLVWRALVEMFTPQITSYAMKPVDCEE